MKMLLAVLLFTASSCLAQENVETNLKTYCKVWGLCKYYSNEDQVDWDQVFFDQYDDLLAAKNDDELNALLSQLIQQTNLEQETNITDSHNFSITDFHKLKPNGDYVLKTDFEWIYTSKNISTQNSHLLNELLKEFNGKKPKTVSVDDKIIQHDKELIYNQFSKQIAVLALLRFYNVI